MSRDDALADGLEGPGVLTSLDRPGAATVVAFGGLMTQGTVPAFEFFRFLSNLGVNFVLLRDHEQAWYQLGVRGAADTADGVGDYLRELLGPHRLQSAVFTGGSMGGYIALLLGSRLGVSEVQAFAPQTFISRRLRRYYKDFRWQKQVNQTWARMDRGAGYLDIKRPLARHARHTTVPLHVHIGTHQADEQHAARIAKIRGVVVHRYPEVPGHNVAATLRDDGRLATIFEDALRRAGREP